MRSINQKKTKQHRNQKQITYNIPTIHHQLQARHRHHAPTSPRLPHRYLYRKSWTAQDHPAGYPTCDLSEVGLVPCKRDYGGDQRRDHGRDHHHIGSVSRVNQRPCRCRCLSYGHRAGNGGSRLSRCSLRRTGFDIGKPLQEAIKCPLRTTEIFCRRPRTVLLGNVR